MALALFAGCRHHETTAAADPPRQIESVVRAESPDCHDDVRKPDIKIHAKRGQALAMRTNGLMLTAMDAAVQREADYSVTSLIDEDLPPLPQGMVNMTASAAGYRLLPGGEHFLPYAELRVTYDPERLPEGYTPDDIYTSFYDTATLAWVRLERLDVDTLNHEIVSATTHFTDFINELLKAPEMPETQAFVPTAMNDLEAVSPMDGLTMIQPPTANNNGTANLSYPLVIPPGRAGMQPNLVLTYSSNGGSGWLGIGWDISVPSITLDTRWGVPRYSASKETEIYLLGGEQLVTKESDGTPRPMPHRTNQQTDRLPDGTQFYARTGDAHDSIIRHGDSTTNYWWEVVDRTGVTHFYGHYPASSRDSLDTTLCDDRGNIARWPLCESRDLYGNTVRYYYDLATVRNRGAEGRQLYLDRISYTGHGDEDGSYTIVFCRDVARTTDIPVVCNNGFKEITDQTLNNVQVRYDDSILTAWLFEMENGYESNYKNRLVSVTKVDSAAGGISSLLASRCDCIHPDEDNDSITLMRLIPAPHYVVAMVHDTTYDVKEHKETDAWGNEYTVSDTVGMHVFGHEVNDTTYTYDTSYRTFLPLHLINQGYAGSTYSFDYYDAPPTSQMFGPEVASENLTSAHLRGHLLSDPLGIAPVSQATGLGLSHSSSWNVGGTAAAGFGPVICLTTTSLGGNYTRSGSASESLMTLVDLDGDGLADKVYVKGGKMFFCRHVMNDDGTIWFEDAVEIQGASHFLEESSLSNTFGVQMSVGFSGSASWTKTKSTTSTYFADVNGDGLVDLVNNGQVLFNSLNGGVPEFTLYSDANHTSAGANNVDKPVVTTASDCGGIIFDGELNDSITCERIWVCDTMFLCNSIVATQFASRYYENTDTTVSIERTHAKDPEPVIVKRYHREWDCDYHDDSPNTDAVRVWVAPRHGEIKLYSEVGLKEDTSEARKAARHADGIVYTIQHSKGVYPFAKRLASGSDDILRTFDICDNCYYVENGAENLYTYDSTFTVEKGDILFFRVRSKESRQFDNVHDRHWISYTDIPYGDYDSKEDFVLSADYCFQAPVHGYYIISGDFTDNSGGFELEINAGETEYHYSGYGTHTLYEEDSIQKDSTICFTVRSTSTSPEWGQVECRPYVVFIPDRAEERYDTNSFTSSVDTTRYTDTIRGWIPCRMDIAHEDGSIYNNTLLRRLFGPLYNGWGQFAYHSLDTGAAADYINVAELVPPDMLVSGLTTPADTNGFGNSIHAGDGLDETQLDGTEALESFQSAHTGMYTPLACSSYWVEVTPDVEHNAWGSYGRQNYIGRDSISNALQDKWYSSSSSVTGTDSVGVPTAVTYDDPVPLAIGGSPAKAVRKSNRSESHSWSIGAAGVGKSGSKGTNTIVTDYLDLNGDRYPDNLGLERVQYSQQWGGIGTMRDLPEDLTCKNSSNTSSFGRSFSASPVVQERMPGSSQGEAMFSLRLQSGAPFNGSGSLGDDRVSGSWNDLNGDGLPDFITDDGSVFLNIGYDFLKERLSSPIEIHAGVSGSLSESVNGSLPNTLFNSWQGSIQGGVSVSGSHNQTTTTMVDINGDGLPDRISRTINSVANVLAGGSAIISNVSFNKGDGKWSEEMPLNIGRYHYSTNYSEALNVGLTYGFTFWGVKATVGADGSPYSGSVNRDYVQLVDVDADGLPDLVTSDGEDNLTVRYNRGGQTNLLRSVTNFNNAVFQIEYSMSTPDYNQPSRSWLMSKVTTHDTLNCNNGLTTTITEYAYEDSHYDRYERTSYCYGTVFTSQVDPTTGNAYRTIERNYHNDNMLRRGKLMREMTRDGSGNPYFEKLFECSYTDYASGTAINPDDPCPEMAYPSEEATMTKYYEGSNPAKLIIGEKFVYDRYHNVVKYTDLGDMSNTNDGVEVTFTYYTNQPNNLIGLRESYTITNIGASTALRHGEFDYDFTHGKLVEQRLYDDTTVSQYNFSYDTVYGNMDTARQPKNDNSERMTCVYTYDNVVHTYPVKIENSHGETMTTDYDYRFGKPVRVTDPTGSAMRYQYDFAGRLIAVTSPLNGSGTPSLVNQYHPMHYYHNGLQPQGYSFAASTTRHPYSVSFHYDDEGNLITKTAVLTGGFGQAIQTKKGLTVGGTPMMQVSGRVVADAFGRSVKQYDPVVEGMSIPVGKYNSSYNSGSLCTTAYDVLDRATATTMPLGVTTYNAYSITTAWNGTRCFVTASTDPNGNVTTTYTDYNGNRVQVDDANGGSTRMQYDNLGQLVASAAPEGFSTQYGYDMLGRLTFRDHPDAGVTSYSYDPAGNLLTENTPLGQISYRYTYYRPVAKRYTNMNGNDVSYTYGTSGTSTGRLVRVVDGSGMCRYEYDALGNVIDEVRTIALPDNNDEVYNFRMAYKYDSWGRMLTMTYPDGEEITYTYQWGGDLYGMTGDKGGDFRVYVKGTFYNAFGQKEHVDYGNQTRAHYTYDALHRLSHLKSYDGSGTLMQDVKYAFDNASNIIGISNGAGVVNTMGGDYDNSYKYDALHRLVGSYGNGIAGNYGMEMLYSPSGRIVTKQSNVQSVSLSADAGMYYGYCDNYQPHAVRQIFDAKSGSYYDLRWDKAGNLEQVSRANSEAIFEAGRFLYWTEDNRLHTVLDDKNYSCYVYDYGGERRIKMTGESRLLDVNAELMASYTTLNKHTLYPSAYMVVTEKGYTKHYYAGTERIAARIGKGGLSVYYPLIDRNPELADKADKLYAQSTQMVHERQANRNDLECIESGVYAKMGYFKWIANIPHRAGAGVEIDIRQLHEYVHNMDTRNIAKEEPDIYFYHSDHLGSASWITDGDGTAIQHLQYLPYGERYVDQRMGGYHERFTFTGKERDEETGYGYFGARYMDHDLMTMWLNVDPMTDKYPSISPYAYCAWNPVRLVDPDGRKIWLPSGTEYTTNMKTDNLNDDDLKIVNALNHICRSEEGLHMIGEICKSDNDINIDFGIETKIVAIGPSEAFFNKELNTKGTGENINIDITWNYSNPEVIPTLNGPVADATYNLLDEICHAYDFCTGYGRDDKSNGDCDRFEIQAVYRSNVVRHQLKDNNYRSHYYVLGNSGFGPRTAKSGRVREFYCPSWYPKAITDSYSITMQY